MKTTTTKHQAKPGHLTLKNITIARDNKNIVENLNIQIDSTQICIIMGPNGAGKSTILNAIMGHPAYKITGSIKLGSTEITTLSPNERSLAGIFLSFQHPVEIPGVKVSHFLRTITNKHRENNHLLPYNVLDFQKVLEHKLKLLNLPSTLLRRNLNQGFSGGEKKRLEIIQLLLCEPKFALLDETDSGLDIDGIKNVAAAIKLLHKNKPEMGILLVTHNPQFLKYINTSKVYILKNGHIVHEGDKSSIAKISEQGFQNY